MKKIFFLLLGSMSFSSSAWCKQWLVFHASSTGNGHTFAAFEKENPETGTFDIAGVYSTDPPGGNTEGMSYLADDTRYTFFTLITDKEWRAALNILQQWKDQYTGPLTDKGCVLFMKTLTDVLPALKMPDSSITVPPDYILQLKRLNTRQDAIGFVSLSEAFVNSRYAVARRSGDTSGMVSATLTDAFIWNVCYPDKSHFDGIGHLVVSSPGNTVQKAELFTLHRYTSGGVQKAVAVFYIHNYTNGKKDDCQPCYPLVSLARFVFTDNLWRLDNMVPISEMPSGGWGKGPSVRFVIRKGRNYMRSSFADVHFGEVSEETSYYNLDTFMEEAN